jgi:hypothetical protein
MASKAKRMCPHKKETGRGKDGGGELGLHPRISPVLGVRCVLAAASKNVASDPPGQHMTSGQLLVPPHFFSHSKYTPSFFFKPSN